MPIKPVRDLLYVLPLEPDRESGLIIKPVQHDPRITQGIVKYRGPQTTGEVKVGDHVIFSGYDGDKLILEDEGTFILLREFEVVAVLLEGESSYVMTMQQVRVALQKMQVRVRSTDFTDGQAAEMAREIINRIIDELDGFFQEEMYF